MGNSDVVPSSDMKSEGSEMTHWGFGGESGKILSEVKALTLRRSVAANIFECCFFRKCATCCPSKERERKTKENQD